MASIVYETEPEVGLGKVEVTYQLCIKLEISFFQALLRGL